jgi:hypothetical protein
MNNFIALKKKAVEVQVPVWMQFVQQSIAVIEVMSLRFENPEVPNDAGASQVEASWKIAEKVAPLEKIRKELKTVGKVAKVLLHGTNFADRIEDLEGFEEVAESIGVIFKTQPNYGPIVCNGGRVFFHIGDLDTNLERSEGILAAFLKLQHVSNEPLDSQYLISDISRNHMVSWQRFFWLENP